MLNSFSLLLFLLSITRVQFGSLPETVRTLLPVQLVTTKLSCWSVKQGVCFILVSEYVEILFVYLIVCCCFMLLFFFKKILQSLFLER